MCTNSVDKKQKKVCRLASLKRSQVSSVVLSSPNIMFRITERDLLTGPLWPKARQQWAWKRGEEICWRGSLLIGTPSWLCTERSLWLVHAFLVHYPWSSARLNVSSLSLSQKGMLYLTAEARGRRHFCDFEGERLHSSSSSSSSTFKTPQPQKQQSIATTAKARRKQIM